MGILEPEDRLVEIPKARKGELLGNHLFDTEVDAEISGKKAREGVSVYVKDGNVVVRLLKRFKESSVRIPQREIRALQEIGLLAAA